MPNSRYHRTQGKLKKYEVTLAEVNRRTATVIREFPIKHIFHAHSKRNAAKQAERMIRQSTSRNITYVIKSLKEVK